MGANEPRGIANLDHRGMIGRFYVGYHLTLYILNMQALGSVVLREEDFFMSFLL